MTSEQPIPIRPRGRPPVRPSTSEGELAAAATNGAHPIPIVPPELRQLTHAIEDLHIAARANGLPPMRVEWDTSESIPDWQDAETRARKQYVETMLADYEGLRSGPIAWPLSEIEPPRAPDAFLVGNFIRPGTTVMLTGPPGAAKSWAARQLALACGAGLEWFLDHYAIERQMNVLVVDEDNGPDEEWRREETLLAGLQLGRDRVANVRRLSLAGVQLDQEPWQRWLRGAIRQYACDLVILDPISEMHGGKELREDPAFRSLLAFLKRLKVDFPSMATLVVHHTRKRDPKAAAGVATLEDVRGQWGQTPDVVALLSPMAEHRARWELHKRVPHSALILEQQGGSLAKVADETVVRSKAMENDDRVIEAIRDGLETFSDIQQGIGMPKSTLNRVLNRLIQAGVVVKNEGRFSAPEDD
jgi:hypothetical protein